MQDWNPLKYSPIPLAWFRGDETNLLGPGTPDREMLGLLKQTSDGELFGADRVGDPEMADACRAGLLLRWDCLDASHEFSQRNHTITGSYWHGIMHRREPDFSNAKYWFRRVGHHPVYDHLSSIVPKLVESNGGCDFARSLSLWEEWDPFEFVDWSARCLQDPSAGADLCRQVALLEWRLLFDYCFERATKSS